MRIVSVTAHPDDVELVCAGLLARLTSVGHLVTITHLARGDKGGEKEDDPALVARIRWDEAESAARLMGAAHRGGWFDDLAIPADERSGSPEAKLVHLLLEEAPDLVLVPPLWDYHPDHRHASSFALSSIGIAASME